MAMENVVSIRNGKEKRSFVSCYDQWMGVRKQKSYNTFRAYRKTFNDFFGFKLNKLPEEVTWDDLIDITNDDFEDFRQHLLATGNVQVITTKYALAHLSWLWKKIAVRDSRINPLTPKLDPLPDKDRNPLQLGSDSLDEREIRLLIDYAKTVDFHPEIQALFFEFAAIVPLRISALRKVSWNNLMQQMNYKEGKMVWVVGIYDKTRWHYHRISDDLYDRLQILKSICHRGVGFKDQDEDPIFYISKEKLMETIDGFKEKYGIDKKITFHSLKKCSIGLAMEQYGGDLRKVLDHSQHNGPEMVIRYAKEQDVLNGTMATVFEDRDKARDKVFGLSKEDLVAAMSKCSYSVIAQVAQQVNG